MAKLGFRKLNLSWRLSLEVLSLLGSSEHCIGYRSAYKSMLCVLEPIIKLSGLQGPLLLEGLGNPSSPGFSISKKMERVFCNP